jgi:hypothetical protein
MHGALDASLREGGRAADAALKALRERAGLVVQIPIEWRRKLQALRRLETKAVHVGEEDEEAGEFLAAFDETELGPLLDRIDGIAAGIGEADDLRLRRLRLE